MTIQQGTKALKKELLAIYDDREAAAITDWVFEYLTDWKKIDRVINKDSELSKERIEKLNKITSELMAHKPVQYVLNQAWFNGMKLYVDENVLIPRPETEELVQWAIDEADRIRRTDERGKIHVLDVGTGSGCIPITLKKERPSLEVYACDISEGALTVAKRNAAQQKTDIAFSQLNFLDEKQRFEMANFHLIVSNPPYISLEEKSTIDKHVVEYEPHQALFVPENDPLVFYKALSDFGKLHLKPGGCMMMEMHFAKGEAVKHLFKQGGYEIELKKDLQQKDRMARVWKLP